MSAKTDQRTEQLLRILSDGQFHSGQSIANRLGVSRAAIWKLIHKIMEWQLPVYSVRGRGYKIPGGINLLDRELIQKELLNARSSFNNLHVLTSTVSTADYVAQLWKERQDLEKRPIVCIAEHQSKGRGRKGRPWISPFAANLYFSIGMEIPLGLSALGGLSLAVGISLTQTLNRLTKDKVKIKWPNDLLVEGKKLAGILVEASGDSVDSSFLNIGIGINWNMQDEQGNAIDQPWTNLKQLITNKITRDDILVAILVELDKALVDYQSNGLAPFSNQWQELSAMHGKPVTVFRTNDQIKGTEAGIDPSGALRLETESGLQIVHSGEVSLRQA